MSTVQQSTFVQLETQVAEGEQRIAALTAQAAQTPAPSSPSSRASAPVARAGGDGDFVAHMLSAFVPGLSSVGVAAEVLASGRSAPGASLATSRYLPTRTQSFAHARPPFAHARPQSRPIVRSAPAPKSRFAGGRFVSAQKAKAGAKPASPKHVGPKSAGVGEKAAIASMFLSSPLRGAQVSPAALPDPVTRDLKLEIVAARRELANPSLSVIAASLDHDDQRAKEKMRSLSPERRRDVIRPKLS